MGEESLASEQLRLLAILIFEALAEWHDRKLVHGDVTPDNIMLGRITSGSQDYVWLIDPAPMDERSKALRAGGTVLATRGYTSERINNGATPSSEDDVYGACKTIARLFEIDDIPKPKWLFMLEQREFKNAGQCLDFLEIVQPSQELKNSSRLSSRPTMDNIFHDLVESPAPSSDFEALAAIRSGETIGRHAVTTINKINAPMMSPPRPDAARRDGEVMRRHAVTNRNEDRPSMMSPPRHNNGMLNSTRLGSRPSIISMARRLFSNLTAPKEEVDSSLRREALSAVSLIRIERIDGETIVSDFLVVGPASIEASKPFVIVLWLGPSDKSQEMSDLALSTDRMIGLGNRKQTNIRTDDRLTAVLVLPRFKLHQSTVELDYRGDICSCSFIAEACEGLGPGLWVGCVNILRNSLPFANVTFDIQLTSSARVHRQQKKLSTRATVFKRSFGSYSSKDRSEVLKRVHGISSIGGQVFIDAMHLRSGNRWQERLDKEIRESESLLLFWSRNAKDSRHVEREWRLAFDEFGPNFIQPVPLEDPKLASPPKELQDLHFNAPYLAYIKACE